MLLPHRRTEMPIARPLTHLAAVAIAHDRGRAHSIDAFADSFCFVAFSSKYRRISSTSLNTLLIKQFERESCLFQVSLSSS